MSDLALLFAENSNNAPITLSAFQNAGWSISKIVIYCNLCEAIRASIITEMWKVDQKKYSKICLENSSVDTITKDQSKINTKEWNCFSTISKINIKYRISRLLEWLENELGIMLKPNFNMGYILQNLMTWSYGTEEPTFCSLGFTSSPSITALLMSPDDFRKEIEDLIRTIMTTNKISISSDSNNIGEISYEDASSKLNTLREQERQMEINEPGTGILRDDYAESTKVAKAWSDWYFELNEIRNAIDEYTECLAKIEERYDYRRNILYVYRGNIRCIRDKHNIESVNAVLLTCNDREVKLNVQRCKNCNIFLISYDEYTHYKDIYGVLIADIRFFESTEHSNSLINRAELSPLMLCGYSVSKTKGLSESERRYVLRKIIELNYMKKHEIMRYLVLFISTNGLRDGNEDATAKWMDDLEYIREYNIENQCDYIVDGIEPYK